MVLLWCTIEIWMDELVKKVGLIIFERKEKCMYKKKKKTKRKNHKQPLLVGLELAFNTTSQANLLK